MSSVMTSIWLVTLTVLAEEEPHNTGPDFGKASPTGLLIVVVLLIATVFLVRSMNRHLKKVPASFEDTADEADTVDGGPAEDDGTHREPGD